MIDVDNPRYSSMNDHVLDMINEVDNEYSRKMCFSYIKFLHTMNPMLSVDEYYYMVLGFISGTLATAEHFEKDNKKLRIIITEVIIVSVAIILGCFFSAIFLN